MTGPDVKRAAQRPGVSRVATHPIANRQKYRSTFAAGQRRLHAGLGRAQPGNLVTD